MLKKFGISLLCIHLLSGCNSPDNSQKLIIAVSANMQFAIGEILDGFYKERGIDYQIIVGSSGKLSAQIAEGAPFDIFLSANTEYPTFLANQKLTKSAPKLYALGVLVLWDARGTSAPSLNILKSESVRSIAIPNPDIAPYGKAALEVLNKSRLDSIVSSKLVFGESVAQTNQFILSGASDIGFTSKSVVMSPALKTTGYWTEISPELHARIEQTVIIINRKDVHKSAQLFYDYLFSENAKAILKKYGYIVD